ncbi:hypothetical protein BJ170DRAFT_678027 [Xylariales sp. AK1849]|nr:hypothetical protein BJ170DRAFT_678027 [Xylariales sp. AK1849]
MSFVRAAIPLAMAVGWGVFNAQYVFKPAFQEEQRKRDEQALAKGNFQKSVETSPKDSGPQTLASKLPASES